MSRAGEVLVPLPAGLVTVVQAPRPAVVTQHNSLEHFGLPAKDFKRLCADGKLPGKRTGRTWAVDYDEGRRALTERAERRAAAVEPEPKPTAALAPAAPPADDLDDLAAGVLNDVEQRVARREARRRGSQANG